MFSLYTNPDNNFVLVFGGDIGRGDRPCGTGVRARVDPSEMKEQGVSVLDRSGIGIAAKIMDIIADRGGKQRKEIQDGWADHQEPLAKGKMDCTRCMYKRTLFGGFLQLEVASGEW